MFIANGCDFDCLKAEFRILISHATKFLSKSSSAKCWPQLFKLKAGLDLFNILHIAELCISIPLSNAKSERVFSYLWRQLSKEQMSLSQETLENILKLCSSNENCDLESYDKAIDLFLTKYPDGTVHMRARHADGHEYPAKRKKATPTGTTIEIIVKPSLTHIHQLLQDGKPTESIDPELIPLSDDSHLSGSEESDIK